ncbi:MAG: serine/threonine protein kinase [Chlorobi bacterium]|nr:MAG: hypothetical protein UZ07_CHB004000726 [Chlorobi bacterium OLB7]MBK8911800.1 serine/threonine protein kinase [Chlorobiota bacterium]
MNPPIGQRRLEHWWIGHSWIEQSPEQFLCSIGTIVAQFDAATQDSGNISYVVQVGDARWFVKTAGVADDPAPLLPHGQRVALLRNAVRLHRSVAHPALPKLHHVIESSAGPLLIYQWCSGDLLGVPRQFRDDPASAYQRFRSLPAATILAALHSLFQLHHVLAQSGWVAVDLYDGSLLYNFATEQLHVVDLDHYHPGPFCNQMGRMFGSARFMAPEEFQRGEMIDQRTTLFTLARIALWMLGDGTLNPQAFRGTEGMLQVLKQATEPNPELRFQTVRSFWEAWCKATEERKA